MKKRFYRFVSIFLCFTLLFTAGSAAVSAAQTPDTEITQGIEDKLSDVTDDFMKIIYNALNILVEALARFICNIYPDSYTWQDISKYDSAADGFLPGREEYKNGADAGNHWSLGFSDTSIVPEDIDCGKYNLGRDLTNKYAKGVYDDQRVRISVIDDNSGDGAVIFGAIDAMGLTSTDVRAIRKGIMEYCDSIGFKLSSINIGATHSHSSLDVQGVSTEFFYKLFTQGFKNITGIPDKSGKLDHAEYFKQYFITKSIETAKEAIADMTDGSLSYAKIDSSEYIKDKRGLIAKEDLPAMPSLRFVPDDGTENTFIVDISCHPTSFSANNGLVSSDYIYYMDRYLKQNADNANVIMVPGALGQLSRDIESPDTENMSEWEAMGAETKALGEAFGELIINADYSEELEPVINVTHDEVFIEPENSILRLAVEINLVNNKAYKKGQYGFVMPTEIGYLEFGNKVAFALLPAEFYPEVFWGSDIAGNPTWDGTQWPYPSFASAVQGVDIYAVSMINDQLGYVVTDNNFAFMGHIIGDDIADETLSVGKHMGSHLAEAYFGMIENFVK